MSRMIILMSRDPEREIKFAPSYPKSSNYSTGDSESEKLKCFL
jgi:hypothetical protein